MTRRIVVIGVPSNIGIKPYDDGRPRGVDRAPTTLREQGLVERLSARDDGDVLPAPYRDFTRPDDQETTKNCWTSPDACRHVE